MLKHEKILEELLKKNMLVVESLKLINKEYKKEQDEWKYLLASVYQSYYENLKIAEFKKNDTDKEKLIKKYLEKPNKDFAKWQKNWEPYQSLIFKELML